MDVATKGTVSVHGAVTVGLFDSVLLHRGMEFCMKEIQAVKLVEDKETEAVLAPIDVRLLNDFIQEKATPSVTEEADTVQLAEDLDLSQCCSAGNSN
jgi:hypothetical protein